MPQVTEISHPLVQSHLSRLRDTSTAPAEFRLLIKRLATILTLEATRDLATREIEVTTPLSRMTGRALATTTGLVPILRAGLGMVESALELLPDSEVWHLGLYRDEATAQPVEYYCKLPDTKPVDVALILDPMLATGGSAISALQALQAWGVPSLKLLSVIASSAGIKAVQTQFPSAELYVCAIDPELNSRKFIVPGLGDAGDRTFNTLR
ncbi:MAG: uracil phosphoribosyltransferase [Planctomycetes bacterium]|nr:uracil phosphoribosyltransferase [Planctomycetota bacterium]